MLVVNSTSLVPVTAPVSPGYCVGLHLTDVVVLRSGKIPTEAT